MTYNYIARNKTNERITGSIEASDQTDAMRRLEGMGLTPVSIECSGTHSKSPTADKAILPPPTSEFERLVFGITRFVALLGAGAVLIGIVGLTFILLSPKGGDEKVTYDDVVKEQSASSNQKSSSLRSDDSYFPTVPLPSELKPFIKGDDIAVVTGWIQGLPEDQQRDFLKNMAEVAIKAKSRGADTPDAMNTYKIIKLKRLQQNELGQYTRMAVRAGYISGIFGLLLILCILGLVLVMLAIERNTRPRST